MDIPLDFGTALKIWAVAGPLLAGAASAIWSRRNQVSDRDYLERKEAQREKTQLERDKAERGTRAREERYAQTREVIAGFLAAAYDYVKKDSLRMGAPTPATIEAASKAYEKFATYSSLILLEANEELGSAAIDVWNTALVMPWPPGVAHPNIEEYKASGAEHKEARAAYVASAKRQLQELR